MLLLIFPAIWVVLALAGIKVSKKGEVAGEFLSLEQGKLIQAVACLVIVTHHMTQRVSWYGNVDKGPVTIFAHIGYFCTAIFFFFSGYGLIISLYTKEDYMGNFLKKRLPAVLIPFWTVNILWEILHAVLVENVGSFTDVFKDIVGINLINGNGWFIIEIAVIYLMFFAVFSLIKNKDAAITILSIAILILMAYAFFQGHNPEGRRQYWFKGEWWYNSTPTFIFGMIFARHRERLQGFCHKYYKVMLPLFAVLSFVMVNVALAVNFAMGYYYEKMSFGKRYAFITLIAQASACILFMMFVVLLNMKLTIGNRVLRYLSRIQVTLFLVHGYFVNELLLDKGLSDLAYFAAVVVCSLIAAAILDPVIKLLIKKITALLMWEKKLNDTLEGQAAEKKKQEIKKRIKTGFAVSFVTVFVLYFAVSALRSFVYAKEYSSECEAIKNAQIGDRVYYGHYDTDSGNPGRERVSWIVIKKAGNRASLLSEYGIAGSYYNQKHQDVEWKKSDLHEYLNSPEFTGIFSSVEKDGIQLNYGDMLTLLTVEEANSVFESDEARQLAITPAAVSKGVNINTPSKANNWDMKGYRSSWWWLRGKNGKKSITAPIVTEDGEISAGEKPVNKPGGAIRPVIWVEVQ